MKLRYQAAVAILLLGSVWLWSASSQKVAQAQEPAQAPLQTQAQFRVQGEYTKPGVGLQVAQIAGGELQILLYNGGLPGAGWDGNEPRLLEQSAEEFAESLTERAFQPVVRSSPTLEAKPPAGAIVLFDGSKESLDKHWETGAKLASDGTLLAGATTKELFRDYRLHVEFRIPLEAESDLGTRGNSGIYHQGRYETQILDSFTGERNNKSCGSLYGVREGDVNAALPPEQWQTYDIEFTEARWDNSGNKIRDASITVIHNGQILYRDQSVPGITNAAILPEESRPGPLHFQDHGSAVTFANVWIVPIDAEKDQLRPRIAGFERFFASSAEPSLLREGGFLLLNELGCISCHPAGKLPVRFDPKKAPKLELVGERIQPGYIEKWLLSPHQAKKGSTMPDVLHGLSDSQRAETAKSLAAYLEQSLVAPRRTRLVPDSIRKGAELYASIGCSVCHGSLDAPVSASTSVPLPDLAKKYTLDGLTAFLLNPHQVRESGRMPSLNLSNEEARDIASYALREMPSADFAPNVNFEIFQGSWDKLPDFDLLIRIKSGQCDGLDLTVAESTNNFAARFKTFIWIDKPGEYTFHIGSDDGSRLLIDGREVVNVDGIHPHQTQDGKRILERGAHAVVVEYFQGGGEWTLALEIEGNGIPRQSLDAWYQLSNKEEKKSALSEQEQIALAKYVADGKMLFESLRCNQCHLPGENSEQSAAANRFAKPLDSLNVAQGCLAKEVPAGLPQYDLSPIQREAISVALRNSASNTDSLHSLHDADAIVRQRLTTLNCYACHSRDGLGGPEVDRLSMFKSSVPEMGDEGRLPPPLTGVGDKLNFEFLEQVLREGGKDRPYMLVRMPRFHNATADLAMALTKLDLKEATQWPAVTEPETRLLAAGRQLVGSKGLACVQCHNFGDRRATGVPAINMLRMTERLREDWFHRYLLHPTQFRPGTRMPASFPGGKSVFTSLYDGDSNAQIQSIWKFLSQKENAPMPEGLESDQIILAPDDRPVIYRNFLEGLSPRAIGIGYPGGANLAWDAERMSLGLIWHGQFIDASKHWRGRGPGNQRPLGDHILAWDRGAPVATLASVNDPWPEQSANQRGYRFLGYKLDSLGQPTFRYQNDRVEVSDFFTPVVEEGKDAKLVRKLAMKFNGEPNGYYLKLAAGNTIVPEGDVWVIDGSTRIKLLAVQNLPEPKLTVRKMGDSVEMLMDLSRSGALSEVVYEIQW